MHWVPRSVVAFIALTWQLISVPAQGAELDVESWLRRPGVRLVAVDFYATWCKPCMDAVPRWKALHDKYRERGLRLIVVAVQDPDGSCANPGWWPDLTVCDDDGFLAERFGAKQLPSGYLWSWRGKMLAEQVHVDRIEAEIDEWMKDAHRVDVEVTRVVAGASVHRDELLAMVRTELNGVDKLTVVASPEEQKRLRELLAASREKAGRLVDCDLDSDMSANGLVTASITGRRARRLQLRLLSAEQGCLIASATTRLNASKVVVSVREAVATLIQKLQRRAQLPWRSPRRQRPPSKPVPPPPPKDDRPAWVSEGSGASKTEQNVLYAVGAKAGIKHRGVLRAAAENKARAEVLDLFRAYMVVVSESPAWAALTKGRPGFPKKSLLADTVSGVEIVDHWFEAKTRTQYARARLDMAPFMSRIADAFEVSAEERKMLVRALQQAFEAATAPDGG